MWPFYRFWWWLVLDTPILFLCLINYLQFVKTSMMLHDRRHYKFHSYHNYIINTVIETFAVGLQSIHLKVINFARICHIWGKHTLINITLTFLCEKFMFKKKHFLYSLTFKIIKRQIIKIVISELHLRWRKNQKLPNFATIKVFLSHCYENML